MEKRFYRFISDTAHGWLEVPFADIVSLGIEDDITEYILV